MNEGQSWRDVTAPDSLRQRVLQGQKPSQSFKWIWRTAAVAGCALLVGVVTLLPRQSSAASSLSRVLNRQGKGEVMFRYIPYWVDQNGRQPKIWSGYVMGNRWRYVQDDMEQSFDGTTTLTYIKRDGIVYSKMGDANGAGTVLRAADLRAWKIVNPEGLTLEHDVTWRGRKVDRYTMRFPFKDEAGITREGVSTLYADPERNLPLYSEDIYSPTKGYADEWQYIDPPNEDLLKIRLPKGIQVREVPVKASSGLPGSGVPEQPAKAAISGG